HVVEPLCGPVHNAMDFVQINGFGTAIPLGDLHGGCVHSDVKPLDSSDEYRASGGMLSRVEQIRTSRSRRSSGRKKSAKRSLPAGGGAGWRVLNVVRHNNMRTICSIKFVLRDDLGMTPIYYGPGRGEAQVYWFWAEV